MTEGNNQNYSTSSSVSSVSQPGRPSSARPSAPAASKPNYSSKKPPIPLIIGIVVVVIAAIIIAVVALGGSGYYDGSAKSGQAPYKTSEEALSEKDKSVQDGKLNLSIASLIEFDSPTSEGLAYIENVPSNKYDMKVIITLDNNGEKVYESGAIKPNSYIEKIKLSSKLDPGTYPATATFTAYSTDSHSEVGQAAAKVSIVVK